MKITIIYSHCTILCAIFASIIAQICILIAEMVRILIDIVGVIEEVNTHFDESV